jgi:hypothetical protein
MSNYGPPGSPQPQDPYQPPQDPYAPRDPYQSAQSPYQPPAQNPYQPPQDPLSSYPPPGSPTGYPGPNPQYGVSDPNTPPPYGATSGPPYSVPSGPPYSSPAAPAYGAPTPPYGAPDPKLGAPYAPPGGSPYPPAGPPKKNNGVTVAVIVGVVLLLVCGCLGGAGWFVFRAAEETANSVEKGLKQLPIATAEPTDDPKEPAGEPSKTPDLADVTFNKGDCLVNDGTDDDPELRKVPCGPDTYEVLSRIPFTTEKERCHSDILFGAPESDANYVHDSNMDFADYVLCLKKR